MVLPKEWVTPPPKKSESFFKRITGVKSFLWVDHRLKKKAKPRGGAKGRAGQRLREERAGHQEGARQPSGFHQADQGHRRQAVGDRRLNGNVRAGCMHVPFSNWSGSNRSMHRKVAGQIREGLRREERITALRRGGA